MEPTGTGSRFCWKLIVALAVLSGKLSGATSSELQPVPLTQCCPSEKFYSVGLNTCFSTPENGTSLSISEDKSLMNLNPEGFQVLTSLISCPDGYLVNNTDRFQLHQNGSLSVEEGNLYPVGEFCLNRILGVDPDQGGVVARFCVPDPYKDIFYARKCCPEDMFINAETRITCQYHNSSVDIQQNANNISVSILTVRNVGLPITCPKNQMNLWTPSSEPKEAFHLNYDGSLALTKKPSIVTNEYCIDHWHKDNSTKFMALVCPPDIFHGQQIYPYMLWISSFFLVATFIVYVLIPELRNIHGVTVMCYIISMSVMYISLGMTLKVNPFDHHRSFCIGLSAVTHFSFLSTFTWLSMLCIDISWTFSSMKPRNIINDHHRVGVSFVYYSLFAWGIPFIIVLIGLVLDNVENLPENITRPHFGEERCWFNYDDKDALLTFVHGPVLVLVLINIICFIRTVVLLVRVTAQSSVVAGVQRTKQRLRLVSSLFLLMGIPWILEVIQLFVPYHRILYFFWIGVDMFNFSSGVFVFILFVCKRKIWRSLKQKMPLLEKMFSLHVVRQLSRPKILLAVSSPAVLDNSISSKENPSNDTSGSEKITVATS